MLSAYLSYLQIYPQKIYERYPLPNRLRHTTVITISHHHRRALSGTTGLS